MVQSAEAAFKPNSVPPVKILPPKKKQEGSLSPEDAALEETRGKKDEEREAKEGDGAAEEAGEDVPLSR